VIFNIFTNNANLIDKTNKQKKNITLDIQLEVSRRLGQQELDYRPKEVTSILFKKMCKTI